jgi:hypothetical protein
MEMSHSICFPPTAGPVWATNFLWRYEMKFAFMGLQKSLTVLCAVMSLVIADQAMARRGKGTVAAAIPPASTPPAAPQAGLAPKPAPMLTKPILKPRRHGFTRAH